MSLASWMQPLCANTAPMPFAAQMFLWSFLRTDLYMARARSWYFFSFSLSFEGWWRVWSHTFPRAMWLRKERFKVHTCGEELTCKRHWQCWAASEFSQTFSVLKCQSLRTVSHASSLASLSLQWSDLHSPGPHSILAKWRFPIKLQASGSSLL